MLTYLFIYFLIYLYMDKKIVKSPYSDYIGNNIYGEYKPEYKAYYERLNSRYPMNRFKIE